jgi:hypothetical protein
LIWLIEAFEEMIMRTLKLFGVAFGLAAGAFVLTMLKDPPKSVASAPTGTIQLNGVHPHVQSSLGCQRSHQGA